MESGIVKWFDKEKGIGLVIPKLGKDEIYFQSRISDLSEGDEVFFDSRWENSQWRAINLRLKNYLTKNIGRHQSNSDNGVSCTLAPSKVTFETDLMIAVQCNYLEEARKLLQDGTNPNEQMPDGRTALIDAVINKNLEFVKLLLQWGANPLMKSRDDISALQIAKDHDFGEIYKMIFDCRHKFKVVDSMVRRTVRWKNRATRISCRRNR